MPATNGDSRRQIRSSDFTSKVFSAEMINRFQRAATWVEAQQSFQRAQTTGRHIDGLIYIKNTGTHDCKTFEVLGITGILFDPNDNLPEFQNNFALTGDVPTAASLGQFVVCNEPIAAGQTGRAWITGICPVRIGSSDTDASYLDITPTDATHLSSNFAGAAQVLYSSDTADDNGDYWAIVRLGYPLIGTFPVHVTKDSGDFSPTMDATYTVTDIDDNDLPDGSSTTSTLKIPEARDTAAAAAMPFRVVSAASPGVAYFDISGGLHLYSVAQEWPLLSGPCASGSGSGSGSG